jgi:hypothetical protein
MKLVYTFSLIADWRRRASWLAQQKSVPDIEAKLRQWQVPYSLWPQMHAVIGKFRR